MAINLDINLIISYLLSPEIQQRILPVKGAFFLITIILGLAIFFLISRTHYFQWMFVQDYWEFFTFRPFGAKKITKIWNKILKRLDSGLESEYKLAIVEADDLLDASLKKMGYAGQGLAERLNKLTSASLANIDNIYEAHKMRNNIVHNPDYHFSLEEAKTTMGEYQKAFDSLQILT